MNTYPDSLDRSSSHRTRRLARESRNARKAVETDLVPIYTVDEISNDFGKWNVTIYPPQTSLYHGGKFKLILEFPAEYPFKSPQIQFLTKIFHPNVDADDGRMQLAVLGSEWCPTYTGDPLLRTIVAELDAPVLQRWRVEGNTPEGDPNWVEESFAANEEAAELWMKDREGFETKVAEWLVMYAVADEHEDDHREENEVEHDDEDYVFV